MITTQKIIDILSSEISPKIIQARNMCDKLRMHVEGDSDLLQKYLKQINNYENEKQYQARKKHAISNRFLTEELLRPTDNVFSAKGGSRSYKFSSNLDSNQETFVQKLIDVRDGISLGEYIENTWFHYHIVDPNGLIFLEVPTEEDLLENPDAKPKPCYKSIHNIRDYEQNGMKVKWVVFEPFNVYEVDVQGNKKTVKLFWAVDKISYKLYQQLDDSLELVKEIENTFEEVPAVLCSNIQDYSNDIKTSPIWPQVELLNKYVTSNSVLSITEFFFNYPREWTYVDDCNICHGSGKIAIERSDGPMQMSNCNTCGGTGKSDRKDVTDIIKLRIPDSEGVKIDPPAGFTTLPTDAWKLQTDSVDRVWNLIYFSHWGTTTEKSDNETATGRFIDVQPVHNRLNKYSKSAEKTHTILAEFLGQHYFPETFENAIVQYGRRYLVETPDQIWEKYLKAKTDGAPVTVLDMLLYQFLESEYRENEEMLMYEYKKAQIEPFIHQTVEQVRQSTSITNRDKTAKEYFNAWCLSIDKNKIINDNLKSLKEDLYSYIQTKITENEQTSVGATEQGI
jgi:hypothetical protein